MSKTCDCVEVVDEDDGYEEPHGSVWVLGVDHTGTLFLVDPPNVWEGYYDEGLEWCGWPPDTNEVGPGVYRVTVAFAGEVDYDVDGFPSPLWEFYPIKWEPLWQTGESDE